MPIDPKTAEAVTPATFAERYGSPALDPAAHVAYLADPANALNPGEALLHPLALEAARRELAEPAVPIVNRVYRVIMPNGQAHDLTQYQAEQLRDDLTRTIAP